MDEAEQLAFSGLAKTKRFQEKVEKAIRLIQETYRKQHSHVAYSCGKDSTVVFHLVQQIDPSVPAYFCSTEQKNYIDNYEEVCAMQSKGFGSIIKEVMLTPVNWEPNKSIKDIIDAPLNDTCYLGLRKSESKNRRIALSKFGLHHYYKSGGERVCPIANWTDIDVWAYIAANNLPCLSFYDSVPKTSAKSRTSVFLGTGHNGSSLAVESRYYASKHNFHFQNWESENQDIVRLMRCLWELKKIKASGDAAYNLLEAASYPVPPKRIEQFLFFREKHLNLFLTAKAFFPYLSMAAWLLYKRIYEVNSNETLDSIIDQLRP
jgi:3'-phosphoadenosine 5'-phosphosulfate sulfotransferase (PAPS reductase)/FAD synthetase